MAEDLRQWISRMESTGDLKKINGADWNLEIGCFADPKVSGEKGSALLFDNIPGYPQGYRVLVPRLVTERQTSHTLNLPNGTAVQMIDMLRQKWGKWKETAKNYPHEVVKDGPILENVHSGSEINLLEFPVPKWHETDGGRYIGTADALITRDANTGEVNLGTYRVMVHDKNSTGIFIAPGHHGRLHMEQYTSNGKPAPVALSVGHHPIFFVAAATNVIGPEYNWIGAVREERVKVVIDEVTGLPIPADAEVVLTGWVQPDVKRQEGPFGEWTGYYGRPPSDLPVIQVERVYHRNNPILTGHAPLRPQPGHSPLFKAVIDSALLHNELESYGVPDVKRVWISEAGLTTWLTVAIKQKYAGHAKRVGLLISQSNTNQQARYVVVVDDDIDPSNLEDVQWAMCFRSDPATDIEILHGCRTEPLDPAWTGGPIVNSIAIIDACKPFERLSSFPREVEFSPEYAAQFRKKWGDKLVQLSRTGNI